MRNSQLEYPLDLAEMAAWITGRTPRDGRVLEIGSGDGALTDRLASAGVDVLGVDPNGTASTHVRLVSLEDLDAAPFDVVFASVSLHHLHDPDRTVASLRRLTKPGTVFLVREFDRLLVDHEPTLRWWYHQRLAHEAVNELSANDSHVADSFDEFVAIWRQEMAHHVLPWSTVRDVLEAAGFTTESEASGAYLYRWGLSESVRPVEEDLAGKGRINRVGVHWSGRRA